MLKATNRKLTGSEKRQIKAVIRRARSGHGNRVSAQQTIPYQRMYPDGVCRVDVNRYNKTIQFQDINYQLSENEDKDAIFGSWCEFINYFDSSVSFEFSFLNLENGQSGGDDRIEMTARQDDFDGIREEYAQMLQNQLARGNNGLRKTKYLTFTIEADSVRNAKPRLERIEAELLGNFKRMGVHAQALDGKARLALLHGIFHMDTKEPFAFDWDWLAPSGLSTRDFIAPASFEFPDGRTFRIGEKFCSASFLQITAADLSDRALEAFLAVDSSLIVSMHIRAIDQTEAVKMVKRKITELDRTKIEEQKRAVRSGYDMDILPSDLTTLDAGAKDMLKSLQNHNERMLMLTFILVNAADTKRKLKADVQQCRSIAQTMNCSLVTLDFQQERAMQAALPLGVNPIRIERGADDQRAGHFHSVYDAGAVSKKRRRAVLRREFAVPQHDSGGSQAAEQPERADSGYAGQRQVVCGEAGNGQRVSGDGRRHHHLRPGSGVCAAGQAAARADHPHFARRQRLHQSAGYQHELRG